MNESPLDKAARLAAELVEAEAAKLSTLAPDLDPPFPYVLISAPLALFGVK